METLERNPNGQYNSLAVSAERKNSVHLGFKKNKLGKSVRFALKPDVLYWFPIRATYHRAKKVYDRIVALKNNNLETYLPMQYRIEYANDNSDNPTPLIKEEPLDKGLLFVRATLSNFRALLNYQSLIPGLRSAMSSIPFDSQICPQHIRSMPSGNMTSKPAFAMSWMTSSTKS